MDETKSPQRVHAPTLGGSVLLTERSVGGPLPGSFAWVADPLTALTPRGMRTIRGNMLCILLYSFESRSMKTTIQLDEDELEALEEEATERGYSNRKDYLRFIIRNRDRVFADQSMEDVIERIEQLEQQMAEREAELEELRDEQ